MYSFFMHDDSTNNQGYEHMLDFQMSWVMRVAASNEIKEKNPILHKRCFDILMKLIGKTNLDQVEVISVKVMKQWKRIDVHAEIVISCSGHNEKHLIVIEDKAYTKIHDDQLNRYEDIINNKYDWDDALKGFEKHFWVITFFGYDKTGDYEKDYRILKSMCDEANADWQLLSYDDILDDYTPTGSEHFDDFWIDEW